MKKVFDINCRITRKRLLIAFSVFLWIYSSSQINAKAAEKISIQNTASAGSFPIVASGVAATLIVDSTDAQVVTTVTAAFSNDISLVSGITPVIQTKIKYGVLPIIIGTLGKSMLIDSLAKTGAIVSDSVKGRWETFGISVVSNPFAGVSQALVIFGSDPRGTAFGVFELSRMMGVSPLVWWSDVLPESKSEIYVTPGASVFGPPSVKYRGLFINDEDWGIQPWAASKMDTDIKNIGPKTYAKVFEFMLRMKANYIWPAMHECTKAFWYYKGNPEMARKYDIVLGSSHAEPMLRNNVDEWIHNLAFSSSSWNWATNSIGVTNYWRTRAGESKNNDAVYTLGMRGIHDSAMPGYSTDQEKANVLKEIVSVQRQMLTDSLKKAASNIPQMFCPYKEALTLYNLGLNLPEDITLTWVDDNFGYIRQLSTPTEQLRSGGAGVYYHFSYYGGPEDYLWLCTTSPSQISYEMSKAYALNAKKLWVFNVGDIKPSEMEFQFAMDMAWDKSKWGPANAYLYTKQWATETFGSQFADDVLKIKQEYYRLAASGKPEHLTLISYSNQDKEQRLKDYSNLVEYSKQLETKIPSRLQDAYYELIGYQVEAAASMNQKIFYAQKSIKLASEGNSDALTYSAKANDAYQNIISLTNKFNTVIANGKWNGMMSYAPRSRTQFGAPTVATSVNAESMPGAKEDTTIIIPAQDYDSKSGAGYNLDSIYGLSENGCAMTVWPLNMTTYTTSNITSAPYTEYNIPVTKGTNTIRIKCLPTFPLYTGMQLRYGLSVDGGTPALTSIAVTAETTTWNSNVLNNYTGGAVTYTSDSEKSIKVRIYFADPGLVLSSITVTRQVNESPYTSYLKNPDFEYTSNGVLYNGTVVRGTPYGWSQTGTVLGNSFGISNDASSYHGNAICWYNLNTTPYAMPNPFELYQTIKGLPTGNYIVRCRLAALSGYITNVRLFANNNVQYYGSSTDYVSNLTVGESNHFAGITPVTSVSKALLSEMAVRVKIHNGDSLKLGIRSSNLKSDGTAASGTSSSLVYGGFKVDYFRLELEDSNITNDIPASFEQNIRINTTDNGLKAYIDSEFRNASIKIYSSIGKLISTQKIMNTETFIPLQNGVYIVCSLVDGVQNSKLLIVQ